MTFKEKLQRDCPGLSDEAINTITSYMCPFHLRYESPDGPCVMEVSDCISCWDCEIPGTKPINKTTLEPTAPRQEDI